MTGRLLGIGLGPGDPELMTLKAYRLIRAAKVIAYPAPEVDGVAGESFARAIAAEAIGPDAEEIVVAVPMRPERAPAQAAYDRAAARIAERLDQGLDVAALCEGDPLFYGSFMYLLARLAGRYACEITPGVTSLTACAAAWGRPLAAREETLTVIPGPLPDAEIAARLEPGGAAAIVKVGRHLPRLRVLITRLGLLNRAGYVSHASLKTQIAAPLAQAPARAPYFSMILIAGADQHAQF